MKTFDIVFISLYTCLILAAVIFDFFHARYLKNQKSKIKKELKNFLYNMSLVINYEKRKERGDEKVTDFQINQQIGRAFVGIPRPI